MTSLHIQGNKRELISSWEGLVLVDNIIGAFLFRERSLALDSNSCQRENTVKKSSKG